MKRIILGALLAATIATPALADHWRGGYGGYRGDNYQRGYYREPGDYYRRPSISFGFSSGYAQPYYGQSYYQPEYYAPPVYYAPRPVVVEPAYGDDEGGYGGYGGYDRGYPVEYSYREPPRAYYRDRGYRCHSSGAGAVLGAIAGGLIGNSVSGYYDRGIGTVAGAGLGAVVGDSVERSC
jgi:hypothetical protein